MLLTAVGFFAFILPGSLYYVAVGPDAHDRLVALGFAVGSLVLGGYSLWEAKAPGPPDRPPRGWSDDGTFGP
jgi:hypothetical protein